MTDDEQACMTGSYETEHLHVEPLTTSDLTSCSN
jgi:hypothetical protein